MSHSRKKSPFAATTTAASEKADKRAANRVLRRKTRILLSRATDDDVLPVVREVSDPWKMAKDGKQRIRLPGYHPLMRK